MLTDEAKKNLIKKILASKEIIVDITEKAKRRQAIEDARNKTSEELFIPEEDEKDDEFVKIVKRLIIKDKISLRDKMEFFKSSTQMSNYKRQLQISNSMSLDRYKFWMNLLGYDFKIVIKKRKESSSN